MEPNPHGRALRRFKDPDYQPLADQLADLRNHIDEIDQHIVQLMARRALCVRDATRFKADAHQVAAPARQAEVLAHVRQMAEQADPGFDGFADVVEQTFRTMMAAYIARQAVYFDQTEPLD